MVPHGAAEDVLASGLKVVELSIAVTSVPDEKKGERLVLLYTDAAGDPRILKKLLDESSLPNLWRPSEKYFLKVDKIPVTPTGKLDVRGVRNAACELVRMLRG
jgi:acyl-[acyl-carrier-protein]-phospholipid O-acyltransferase/long-chain-fatty-acid--[acyl-carrier-protein] ligase